MVVLGAWSGHDASWATVDEGGNIAQHCEIERHVREKEPAADSLAWYARLGGSLSDVSAIATCWSIDRLRQSSLFSAVADKRLHVVGHHEAHAADARYASHFDSCAVLVIDGGGYDDEHGTTIATSIWTSPNGNVLVPALKVRERDLNVGGVWTRATRYVFGLESGWPQGHQAGSVMAMAAYGDPQRFIGRFTSALTVDRHAATAAPPGHVRGMSARDPRRPAHPYFHDLEAIANRSPQDAYDLAAGLQAATEKLLLGYVDIAAAISNNICITGGVALNTAFIGRLLELRPNVNVFVPPVPYDAGLCVGAARHMLHVVDGVMWQPSTTWDVPYRGSCYSAAEVNAAIVSAAPDIVSTTACDSDVIDLLVDQRIIAIFSGRSESGRRALGHRSIIADPRDQMMKDRVNHRVKHRQSFRPFAPSVLREHVAQWFEHDVDSPFMTTVAKLRPEMLVKVPAVVHIDGSARLQTLTSDDNGWYYEFVRRWYERTGVPMILNTSFNDREPICESPEHAIRCFQNTNIDALYFADHGLLVTKGASTQ